MSATVSAVKVCSLAFLALAGAVGLLAAALASSGAEPERDPRLALANRGAPGSLSRSGARSVDVLVSAPIVQVAPTATAIPTPVLTTRCLGEFKVTGYGNSPRNGTDGRGITRSGEKTRWGVVAVDPQVIPLRSRILIEGFPGTVFDALDTGGAVIGHHVDVWFPTDEAALSHGVQRRAVELVEGAR